MYISIKFKCQLSFKWHINLIEVKKCATQSWSHISNIEWVSDCNAKRAIFRPYHGENQFMFNMMMKMMSALYFTNKLSWIFIELAYWITNAHEDMLFHPNTLSRFWDNHSMLLLLKVVPYTSGKILSARLIFLFFWQCVWIYPL
jgi:hypothetical protein